MTEGAEPPPAQFVVTITAAVQFEYKITVDISTDAMTVAGDLARGELAPLGRPHHLTDLRCVRVTSEKA